MAKSVVKRTAKGKAKKAKAKMVVLDSSMVNFVCHRCQRIYFQASVEEFDADREGTIKKAYDAKRKAHDCKA